MAKTPLAHPAGPTTPLFGMLRVPSALKSREFRNYWFGMLGSVSGYQMLVMFSMGWLIRIELTDDTRYLGYLSTAIAVPQVVFNLPGGVFADKLNPKRLLWYTQFSSAIIVAGLGLLTALEVVEAWHVLVAGFLIGAVQAFDNPTRMSIFPHLVERKAIPSAVALTGSIWTGSRIFAPLAAGFIIGQADISLSIFISALGFFTLAVVSRGLNFTLPERAHGKVLEEMLMGFVFIKKTPIFLSLIGMTYFTGMFGMSYVFLMPVFAEEVFDVGAEKIVLLMGAAGLGALIGIIVMANLGKARRKGWVLIGGATLFGVFLSIFGVTSNAEMYWASMAVLFFSDLFASVFLMSVMTTLHTLVPDQFRGRVMGIYGITWALVSLGGLQVSFIAHYGSAPLAVAINGGLVVAFSLGVALFNGHVRSLTYSS